MENLQTSTTTTLREVTVYSTRGEECYTIKTSASTWEELANEIGNRHDLDMLSATESINKTTLEAKSAVLPKEDFTLFLRPKQTKAGAFVAEEDVENMDGSDLIDFITENSELCSFVKNMKGDAWFKSNLITLKSLVIEFLKKEVKNFDIDYFKDAYNDMEDIASLLVSYTSNADTKLQVKKMLGLAKNVFAEIGKQHNVELAFENKSFVKEVNPSKLEELRRQAQELD